MASNVLSQRLATLVEEGIAERHRYSEHPERFEYRLTEKGRDLQPVLLALLRLGRPLHRRCRGAAAGDRPRRLRQALPHGPDLLGVRRRGPTRTTSRAGPAPATDEQRASRAPPPRRARARPSELARALIVGCGCRGRELGERLLGRGLGGARHQSRATRGWRRSRRPGSSRRWPIPTARRRVLDLVADVAVVLLAARLGDGRAGEARGDPRPAPGAAARTPSRHAGARLRLRGVVAASIPQCWRRGGLVRSASRPGGSRRDRRGPMTSAVVPRWSSGSGLLSPAGRVDIAKLG